MFKFKDWKIRKKILSGFFIVIFFIGILGGLLFNTLQDVVDKKMPLVVSSERILTYMLEMRKNEKDFLLIDSNNSEFFKTGESGYIKKFTDNYNNILKEIDIISSSDVIKNQKQAIEKLNEMKNLINNYHDFFIEVVNTTKEKGYKEHGVVGELREAVHNIERTLNSLDSNDKLQISMLKLRRYEKDYLIRKDLTYTEELANEVMNFKLILDQASYDENIKLNLTNLVNEYKTRFDRVVSTDKQIGLKNTEGLIGKYRGVIHQLEPLYEDICVIIDNSIYNELNQVTRETLILIIGIVIIAILLSIIISNLITKPIKKMVKVAQRIALGDLTEEIKIPSKDETGELSSALKDMQEHLRNLIEEVITTVDDVTTASNNLSIASEENAKISEELSVIVENVAVGAEKQSIDIQNTNDSISSLMNIVVDVKNNSDKMNFLANDISQKANVGKDVLNKAVNQMNVISATTIDTNKVIIELNGMSQKIGDILEVISGISKQTNLLALNAAIEAASAGERGKGFTVVAEEVRKLAEHSQIATQEISELIIAMQSKTELVVLSMENTKEEVISGQSVIKDTGDIFNKILLSIKDTLNQINNVSSGMIRIEEKGQEANSSVNNVSEMIESFTSSTEEMNASAEEQAATSEENSATAEELGQMAIRLRELVQAFKIK
ncbi:methyl-accepting chemotaxis protein [Oceanirhabdus sp. W0125-5]|uniref:methyl-accepting chemotaxis protein n=1 Tax=Oceanirhabdus sp. W0125-5 TaxID=2999116 RepID=UPI0022F2C797|nr:HAMP domain-containing methyl-accepting chemotaxis protein [Oceanirhabdus sp. W0125-5]WBW94917.1 HAMP domain-containing methyl-accepting chemotaxis protein [Oceanirhabdus sp. W0125-5]